MCRNYGAVLVDVENLRGMSAFRLSYDDVVHFISKWVSHVPDLRGRVVLAIDHGSSPSSFWLPENGLSIVFSGPSLKADDVVAVDAIPFFADSLNTSCCVVTADRGLIQRCHRVVSSGRRKRIAVIKPLSLLQDLELLMRLDTDATASTDWELQLGMELMRAQVHLRACVMRNKWRKACKLKVSNLEARLGPDRVRRIRTKLLPLLVDTLHSSRTTPFEMNTRDLSPREKEMLSQMRDRILTPTVQRKKLVGDSSPHSVLDQTREGTRDRVTRVESMRLQLEHVYGEHDWSASDGAVPAALAYIRSRRPTDSVQPCTICRPEDPSSLRVVVISDTRDNEFQLGDTLPPGDLLLLLGGFFATDQQSVPGSRTTTRRRRRPFDSPALGKFDQWLAQQPHRHKIVLRGRGDPQKVDLPQSQALYVGQPMHLDIDGYSFALVPDVGRGLTNRCFPKTRVDVVASHIPPLGLLDRCMTGHQAAASGSSALRRGLDRMLERTSAPILVLCGHVRTSRGAIRHESMLVVNAATTPHGVTQAVGHEAAVIHINRNLSQRTVKLVHMASQYEYLNQGADSRFFDEFGESPQLLLAVDLGLRTGLCLFDSTGKLRRYADRQFDSNADLEQGASQILSSWERDEILQITHVAIEGSDPDLLSTWSRAIGNRLVLNVRPDQWRQDLLAPEDRECGEKSKGASRILARTVIDRFGAENLDRAPFSTDCAESILVGLHVAQRLGWIDRELPELSA
jgi:hypothetical protein